MKTLIVLVSLFTFQFSFAQTTVYKNKQGNEVGHSKKEGKRTTYYNKQGNSTGYSRQTGTKTVTYYNKQGNQVGTSKTK